MLGLFKHPPKAEDHHTTRNNSMNYVQNLQGSLHNILHSVNKFTFVCFPETEIFVRFSVFFIPVIADWTNTNKRLHIPFSSLLGYRITFSLGKKKKKWLITLWWDTIQNCPYENSWRSFPSSMINIFCLFVCLTWRISIELFLKEVFVKESTDFGKMAFTQHFCRLYIMFVGYPWIHKPNFILCTTFFSLHFQDLSLIVMHNEDGIYDMKTHII